jgi:hypothetical protein
MARDIVRYYPGNHTNQRLWLLGVTLAKLAIFGAIMALVF